MKLTLTIKLGNDAMQSGADLAQALRKVADHLEGLGHEPLENLDDYDASQNIRDANGNTVGRWSL